MKNEMQDFLTYLKVERRYSPETIHAYDRDIQHFYDYLTEVQFILGMTSQSLMFEFILVYCTAKTITVRVFLVFFRVYVRFIIFLSKEAS